MTILSQAQIAGLAQQVGLTGTKMQVAAAIAMAESGGDTNALNPGVNRSEYSVGLWQINLLAHPQYTQTQMQDPLQNARAMYAISSGGTNWNPWGSYTNGSYQRFLTNVTPIPVGTTQFGQTFQPLALNTTTNPAVTTDAGSGFRYVLAYTIIIALFVFLAKFRIGYNAIYYALLLSLIFLLVTQAQFIANAIAPVTSPTTSTTSTTPQTVTL